MKKQLGLITLLSLAVAGSAFAAESIPAPGKLTVGGVKVHALVDTYYQYNFNRTGASSTRVGTTNVIQGQSGAAQTSHRSYDTAHRNFEINQATVGLSTTGTVGFDLRVGVGNQIEQLNAAKGASQSSMDNVRKATVSWNPNAFSVTAGRFDTEAGFERIDSVDNWNYGRSLAYTYLQTRFLTGVQFGYDFGSGMSFQFGYGNGVDRYVDNNRSGAYSGKFTYAMSKTTFVLNYTADAHRANVGNDFRNYVNANIKHMYSDTLGVGFDASWLRGANESTGNSRGLLKSTARYGVAAYGSASFMADSWESLRVEWLHDNDGLINQRDSATNYFSSTFTHKYSVSKNLSVLGELRWDYANQASFMNESNQANNRDNQVTLLAGMTFNI